MNKTKKYVTPSILNVPVLDRRNYINKLVAMGIEWIHYDFMDGIFVPNKAIEIDEFIKLRKHSAKHIADAHLMVQDVETWIEELINWSDYITIHYEASSHDDILKILQKYRHRTKMGIAIKPDTDVEKIKGLIPLTKLVLVMSVEPGKGGQKFIPTSLVKVEKIRSLVDEINMKFANEEKYIPIVIQIDGGIDITTGPHAFKAGVDAAVSGTFLMNNLSVETIENIKG
ncbi:ribulose-phosphate 3-epimerase [Mycoplasma testudineum]|uniref:Ribulose-phosphate 3-epimerase n=1 Tax=Mycoplasma testudineum TaxID=244584 RepID=A0A4R6IB67_9MOLU|nr:ribulose-phosphate 3-epimerase [Mycoplasma testudineum]OYD26607.1 ribulose-phosphate 3-epimerase [Mycoplasma testudineum]TDO19440.1 ribulose-phosphate 3-epimerase [Mycoplasma testudineum]